MLKLYVVEPSWVGTLLSLKVKNWSFLFWVSPGLSKGITGGTNLLPPLSWTVLGVGILKELGFVMVDVCGKKIPGSDITVPYALVCK